MKKTGRKWKTAKCGRCGEAHSGYSGKLDAEGVEYVVCGRTNKRMDIKPRGMRGAMFGSVWEEDMQEKHTTTTIMPDCPVCSARAIRDEGGPTTCLGGIPFVGEDGMEHHHDPNTHTGHWVCPNGHEWKEEVGFQCSCGWKGKPWTHTVKILKGEVGG